MTKIPFSLLSFTVRRRVSWVHAVRGVSNPFGQSGLKVGQQLPALREAPLVLN